MNLLSVSARKLHRRSLRMRDRLIDDASLFPFFDQGGRCEWVMMVTPSSSEIWLVQWRPRLFSVPLWGPIVCADDAGVLQPIGEEETKAVQALWHYDPWWVLSEDRYASHWATSLLKETNCAEQLDSGVKMAFFRRDLSHLSCVYLKRGMAAEFRPWKSRFLPARREAPRTPPAPPTASRREPMWRLEPIWRPWTDR